MEFSKDQKEALESIISWYTSHRSALPVFLMAGAAGCGKSTLISQLKNYLPPISISYCTFTGKASTVLRRKMSEFGISDDQVSTIHSLMYKPILDPVTGEVTGWRKNSTLNCDLIVVDEASMVPKELYDDLTSYKIPILFVGDHYQLPPVSKFDFNLMSNPFVKLEKPHRFAENSPIIKVATMIRSGDKVPYGIFGNTVSKRRMSSITDQEKNLFFQSEELKNGQSIILCGFNKTRVKLNKSIREKFGYTGLLNYGERIICLKNNNKTNIPLYNGEIGTVKHVAKEYSKFLKIHVEMDGYSSQFNGLAFKDVFSSEKPELYGRERKIQCFDYGYAISTHKSQGSQWKRVCVFEEECPLWEHNRWLYTAVTRAESELLIINQ
jgi:exodeoxyribonuclease V